jgi:hypothetical protein
MNRQYSFQNAPRCSATSKRTRERCKALPSGAGGFVASTERGSGPRGNATECSNTGPSQTRPCMRYGKALRSSAGPSAATFRSISMGIGRRRLDTIRRHAVAATDAGLDPGRGNEGAAIDSHGSHHLHRG